MSLEYSNLLQLIFNIHKNCQFYIIVHRPNTVQLFVPSHIKTLFLMVHTITKIQLFYRVFVCSKADLYNA